MIASRRPATLLLLPFIGPTFQARRQEATPTGEATGSNPPATPTNLQALAVHDSVALAWTASTDRTVTYYAILRRNPDVDASQVFHVIESDAGPVTSYTDSSVSASRRYNYRVKAVRPNGVSQWSGYVKAETSGPTPSPTYTPTPEPEPRTDPVDPAPTNLTAALAGDGGANLSRTSPVAGTGSTDTACTHATARSGHTATSGPLNSPSGQKSRTVLEPVLTGTLDESAGAITLALSEPSGWPSIIDGVDTGAIDNEEASRTPTPTPTPEEETEGTPTPPAAAFSLVPDSHDGSGAFTFDLAFSENVKAGFRRIRDGASGVAGAHVDRPRHGAKRNANNNHRRVFHPMNSVPTEHAPWRQ